MKRRRSYQPLPISPASVLVPLTVAAVLLATLVWVVVFR